MKITTINWLASTLAMYAALATFAFPAIADEKPPHRTEEHGDFNPGRQPAPGSEWTQAIVIQFPALRSDVKGNVNVEFHAPGMTAARALCWQQPTAQKPDAWGHDVNLAPELTLDADGHGSFVFPADDFPNGPITLRLLAKNDATQKQDVRELQLFNTGGVVWNQGIPRTDPPAARGMNLTFADDFDGPLSISSNGRGKRYQAHKPGGGDFSGWPFTGPEGAKNPFAQRGTFLRIHASKNPADPRDKGSTGILSPLDADGNGVLVAAPFYMECRFIAQSAPGTWPAFWALGIRDEDKGNPKAPVDEPDVIEAYGGVGKGNPNGHGLYEVTTHFWNQMGSDGKEIKLSVPSAKSVHMTDLGGGSSWSTTFHTYGLLVTPTDTAYYCDDIEVLRHPTQAVSKTARFHFLINYAIGGISGWKIDLKRDGDASDMWVDYVRVYHGE